MVLLTGCHSTSQAGAATTQPSAATSRPTSAPSKSTIGAAPLDISAAAQQAGLPMLGQEMLAVHYHAHLDVIVDGRQITVPAGLGIANIRQAICPLHTHDTSGIVHIESAQNIPFTLGQFFTEWGQPLTNQQAGPTTISSGEVLRVYNNGTPVTGDPAALKLQAHQEIAVWVGPSSATSTRADHLPVPRRPVGPAVHSGTCSRFADSTCQSRATTRSRTRTTPTPSAHAIDRLRVRRATRPMTAPAASRARPSTG
jgi:hypothetical protein